MLKQTPDGIKSAAMDFDNAIEKMDIEKLTEFFTDDCEVIVLSEVLKGKDGVRKFFSWLFANVVKIKFVPVNIMVENDVFFEEFTVNATFHDGTKASSNQAEVLVFNKFKITSLRIYFDRLDFANSITKNVISKTIVNRLIKKSLEGLL